jgi:oxaloacetate decarboxylase gamma subunit
MSGDLQTGFLLLGVGMITVFAVLGIVVLVGKLLMALLGRLEIETQTAPGKGRGGSNISPPILAAITAAIHIYTEGRGHIEKVERKNK